MEPSRSWLGRFGGLLMVAGFVPLLVFAESDAAVLVVGVVVVAATLLLIFRDTARAWVPALAWVPFYAVFFVRRLDSTVPGLSCWPLPFGWFVGSVGAGCVAGTSLAGQRWGVRTWAGFRAVACAALCFSPMLPAVAGEAACDRLGWTYLGPLVAFLTVACLLLRFSPADAGSAGLLWLGMTSVFLFMILGLEPQKLSPPAWIAAFTGGTLALAAAVVAHLQRLARRA